MTRAEIAIGKLAHVLGTGEVAEDYGDTELDRYMNVVGRRVARHSARATLPWTFVVLDSPNVDARAYPGGRVVITRGALAVLGSEAELAAVFAHEVAHVSSHHSDSVWRPDFPELGGDDALLRSAARDADHERQADALALGYLAAAHYDPRALGVALRALDRGSPSQHSADDPHPALDARLSRIAVLVTNPAGEWGRERYLSHLDGLALGPGRRAPRLVGQRYVVPGSIEFQLPPELHAVSNGNLLEAKAEDGRALTLVVFNRPDPWSRAFVDAMRSFPHTVTELAGRPVYSIQPKPNGASLTLVDRGNTLLLLVAGDDMMSRILTSAIPAPIARRGPHISLQRAKHATELGALLDAACPDTPNVDAERLNGISPSQRLRAGSLVKCVSPNSIAEGPRRK